MKKERKEIQREDTLPKMKKTEINKHLSDLFFFLFLFNLT